MTANRDAFDPPHFPTAPLLRVRQKPDRADDQHGGYEVVLDGRDISMWVTSLTVEMGSEGSEPITARLSVVLNAVDLQTTVDGVALVTALGEAPADDA